jgi:hypothetical protein
MATPAQPAAERCGVVVGISVVARVRRRSSCLCLRLLTGLPQFGLGSEQHPSWIETAGSGANTRKGSFSRSERFARHAARTLSLRASSNAAWSNSPIACPGNIEAVAGAGLTSSFLYGPTVPTENDPLRNFPWEGGAGAPGERCACSPANAVEWYRACDEICERRFRTACVHQDTPSHTDHHGTTAEVNGGQTCPTALSQERCLGVLPGQNLGWMVTLAVIATRRSLTLSALASARPARFLAVPSCRFSVSASTGNIQSAGTHVWPSSWAV